jgi:hypothetical protein
MAKGLLQYEAEIKYLGTKLNTENLIQLRTD